MTSGKDHHRLDVGLACAHLMDRSDVTIEAGDTDNHQDDAVERAKCPCLTPTHETRTAIEPRCGRRIRQVLPRTTVRERSTRTNATRGPQRCPIEGCVKGSIRQLVDAFTAQLCSKLIGAH